MWGTVRLDVAKLAIVVGLLTVGDAAAQTRAAPSTRPPPAARPQSSAAPERPVPARPPAPPDLVIIDISPGSGLVSATIRNVGRGPAPAGRAALFVSGVGRTDTSTPALEPGATAVIRFRAPAAGARFQIMVDPDNLIAEANEANNRPLVQAMPSAPGRVAAPPPVLVQGPVVKTTSPLRFVGETAQVSAPVSMTVATLSFTGQSTSLSAPISKTTAPLTFTGAATDTAAPIQKTTSPLIFVGKP